VSSSNFPRFDRNLNTGGHNYDETETLVAHNEVHHSKLYPSGVTITVVKHKPGPGGDGRRRAVGGAVAIVLPPHDQE